MKYIVIASIQIAYCDIIMHESYKYYYIADAMYIYK